jgi:hypothetical protein
MFWDRRVGDEEVVVVHAMYKMQGFLKMGYLSEW